jgi:hypothetical protein
MTAKINLIQKDGKTPLQNYVLRANIGKCFRRASSVSELAQNKIAEALN